MRTDDLFSIIDLRAPKSEAEITLKEIHLHIHTIDRINSGNFPFPIIDDDGHLMSGERIILENIFPNLKESYNRFIACDMINQIPKEVRAEISEWLNIVKQRICRERS